MLISDSDLFEVEYANIHTYIYSDIIYPIYADIFEVEYAPNPNVYESAAQEWPTLLQTPADVKQKIEDCIVSVLDYKTYLHHLGWS